jgi:hypothetical protein
MGRTRFCCKVMLWPWTSKKRPKCYTRHVVSIWWSFLWNSCKIWQTWSTRKGGAQWTKPIWPSNKNQWQGAQADPKQKQDRAKTEQTRLQITNTNMLQAWFDLACSWTVVVTASYRSCPLALIASAKTEYSCQLTIKIFIYYKLESMCFLNSDFHHFQYSASGRYFKPLRTTPLTYSSS